MPPRSSEPAGSAAPLEVAGVVACLRDGGRPLAAGLVAALALKLLVVMAAWSDDPLARHPTSDARYYLTRAAGILGRFDDPLADEPFHLPPLYPYVLAAVPGAVDGGFAGVAVLQAVVGTAALAGVFLLARRRAGRVPAFVAAGLTLLYGPLTFFETKLLGDSLACSLLVFALVAADAIAARGARGAPVAAVAAGLGVLLGTAALLRPQALLLVPVLAAWLAWRRRPGGAAAVLVAAGLVLLPSTLHNAAHGAPWTPVSDNGGVNLWLANTGPPSGTFLTHDEAFGDIDRQAASARAVAEARAGRALTPGEVSATLRDAAWEAVRDDPATFLRRVGLRLAALVETFETGIVSVPEVEARLVAPLGVLALPFGVLLALGTAGVVLAGGRRREGPRAPLVPLLAVAGMVVLTTAVFFHYSRFRLPLVPLLAVGAACGVAAVRAGRPTLARAAAALALAGAAAWASWQPGPHHADTVAIGWTSLAEARMGLAPAGRDRTSADARRAALERAHADVERALDAAPGLVRARLTAHGVALGLQRFDEAARHLDAVADVLEGDPKLLVNRAWLALTPHPANRHYDPDTAAGLVASLRQRAVFDPELAPHVDALEAALRAAPRRDG